MKYQGILPLVQNKYKTCSHTLFIQKKVNFEVNSDEECILYLRRRNLTVLLLTDVYLKKIFHLADTKLYRVSPLRKQDIVVSFSIS